MIKNTMARGRVRSSALFLSLCLMGLAFLVGCSGSVSNVHTATDFTAADLTAGKIAIGAVVLGARSNIDLSVLGGDETLASDPAVQTDTWSPALFGKFLGVRPDLEVWPWPRVREQVDPAVMADLHSIYARGGIIKPDQLKTVATDLPAIRYLVLTRVDGTDVETNTDVLMDGEQQRDRDDRDVHSNSMNLTAKARRHVTMAMEIYDLKTGRSVWAAVGQESESRLINADALSRSGLQVKDTGSDAPKISIDGTGMKFPELEEVMEKTCEALIEKLPGGD